MPSTVHVLPFQISVELSVLVPLEPPDTMTCPKVVTPLGSRFMAWPHRGEVMLPVVLQLPGPDPGSKMTAEASVVDPFFPPAIRILPPERTTAVPPSRTLGIDARVLKADCAGSNKNTDERLCVPSFPPASSTLLLSCVLVVWTSVAVPETPAGRWDGAGRRRPRS